MNEELLNQISAIVDLVREKHPLVHHLTNVVTVNDCANVTLAIGAAPVMAPCALESADMAAIASAVVINIGTPDETSAEAMTRAAVSANAKGIPVLLDPVGVGATPFRTELIEHLVSHAHFDVIRGNLAELATMAGEAAQVRGVDSGATAAEPATVAKVVAQKYGCVAAITGAVDHVSDGTQVIALRNGDAMLSRVTGTGCMASSLCASCIGAAPDQKLLAVAAGISIMSIAGELAKAALRPGQGTATFHTNLLDAISLMVSRTLREKLK